MKFSILLVTIYTVVYPSTANGRFDELNNLVKRWRPDGYRADRVPIRFVEYRDGPLVNLNELLSCNISDDVVSEENYTVKVPQLYQYVSVLYVFHFERILAIMLAFFPYAFENRQYFHRPPSQLTFFRNLAVCHDVFLHMYYTLNFFDQFMHRQVAFRGDRLTNDIQRALFHVLNVSNTTNQVNELYRTELGVAHDLIRRFYENNLRPMQDYIYDAANNSKAMISAVEFLNSVRHLHVKLEVIKFRIDQSLSILKSLYTDLGFKFDEDHQISIIPLPQQNTTTPPDFSDEDDE